MGRLWVIAAPAVGIAVTISLPFIWSWQGRRDERTAIEAMFALRAAQEQFHSEVGGYAVELDALVNGCPGTSPEDLATALTSLRSAGYRLMLRPAAGVTPSGVDCRGRATAGDYYVAAAPIAAETYAQRAYAAMATGRVYLFFDAVAPREADIESGLATPLDTLDEFRIP